jgi:hypothetical protein
MNESSQPDSEQNIEAPAKLVTALKESSRREIFVPPYVDRAVLDAARAHFNRSKKTSAGGFRRWLLWPALVTSCAIVVLVIRTLTTSTQFAREDLNRDGKVDILDSFALARELKSGRSLPKSLDVNGDGIVDERDVTSVAARAVALGKDGRS